MKKVSGTFFLTEGGITNRSTGAAGRAGSESTIFIAAR